VEINKFPKDLGTLSARTRDSKAGAAQKIGKGRELGNGPVVTREKVELATEEVNNEDCENCLQWPNTAQSEASAFIKEIRWQPSQKALDKKNRRGGETVGQQTYR